MHETPLILWETYFFLIGSAAAGLTGLQFVAITIISESRRRATTREIEAFATPTIVHFVGVLVVSAILSAPWQTLTPVSMLLGVFGLVGLAYTFLVMTRTRAQKTYRPVFEDWLFHVMLPLVAYTSLLASAVFLSMRPGAVLFVVAGATLLLMLIGIHNAWDAVTYITVEHVEKHNKKK